jgi:hypothetical protein
VVYKKKIKGRSDVSKENANNGGRLGRETVMVTLCGKTRLRPDGLIGGQVPSDGTESRKCSKANGVPPG